MYDLMGMAEELVSGMVKHIHGSYTTKYHTSKGEEITINWEAPWKRIDMIPALEECTGEKFPPSDQLHTEETGEFLKGILNKTGVECNPPLTNARMLDALVGEYLESQSVSSPFDASSYSNCANMNEIDQPYLHLRSPPDDVAPCQVISRHSGTLRAF